MNGYMKLLEQHPAKNKGYGSVTYYDYKQLPTPYLYLKVA